jgi:hypothetical protein
MPKIYKEKNKYIYKIPAYQDIESCELNNKTYNEKNKPEYSDVDGAMFSIMCSLIIDFVEKEKPLDRINWEFHEESAADRDEFMKLYRWAKAWPKYVHRIENTYLVDAWSFTGTWSLWSVYENKMLLLEDQFMRRMIDVRYCL